MLVLVYCWEAGACAPTRRASLDAPTAELVDSAQGADWSWVYKVPPAQEAPTFQLWVVSGYSDVTRLHLTIVLFSSLLLTWATELAFFDALRASFQAEVVGMGAVAIIFMHVRWFFRQAYSSSSLASAGAGGRDAPSEDRAPKELH